MKNTFMAILLLGTLTACGSLPMLPWPKSPASSAPAIARPAPEVVVSERQASVASTPEQQLFDEAKRLSAGVSRGELSRVAVADRLDALRIRLVGRNRVDDDVSQVYRQIAINRDAGKISSADAQQQMQTRLLYWRNQWPGLKNKPAKPAFTLFMLSLYNLPALSD